MEQSCKIPTNVWIWKTVLQNSYQCVDTEKSYKIQTKVWVWNSPAKFQPMCGYGTVLQNSNQCVDMENSPAKFQPMCGYGKQSWKIIQYNWIILSKLSSTMNTLFNSTSDIQLLKMSLSKNICQNENFKNTEHFFFSTFLMYCILALLVFYRLSKKIP